MLFYDSLLVYTVDGWLQGIKGNQTHFTQPGVQSYLFGVVVDTWLL